MALPQLPPPPTLPCRNLLSHRHTVIKLTTLSHKRGLFPWKEVMSDPAMCMGEGIIRTGSTGTNKDLVRKTHLAHEQRSHDENLLRMHRQALVSRTDAHMNQDQHVATSINSVRTNKRGTMSISSVHTQEDLAIQDLAQPSCWHE